MQTGSVCRASTFVNCRQVALNWMVLDFNNMNFHNMVSSFSLVLPCEVWSQHSLNLSKGTPWTLVASLQPCKVGLIALNCLGEVLGCLGLLLVQDEHGWTWMNMDEQAVSNWIWVNTFLLYDLFGRVSIKMLQQWPCRGPTWQMGHQRPTPPWRGPGTKRKEWIRAKMDDGIFYIISFTYEFWIQKVQKLVPIQGLSL